MAKKKHKKCKHCRALAREQAGWGGGQPGYGSQKGPMKEMGALGGMDGGILRSLGLGGSPRTEQFLLGALVGAGAAYVLSNDELRGKLIKSAMKLYSDVAGGIEEMKEQAADLKAEVEAERGAT